MGGVIKMDYAMIRKSMVIDVLHNCETEPHWPPDPTGNPVISIACDETVKSGMRYDAKEGIFSQPEPDTTKSSQLDRIESTLALLTADTVTEESISTAISEGVNEV